MSKVDLLIQTAIALNNQCLPYAGEGANGIGCSAFVRHCLYGAGVITKAERDNNWSMWAGQSIVGFLSDTKRFEKIPWNPANLKRGDILWSFGHHVAIWDGSNGVYEACPITHGLSSNGKTAVGHFPKHGYYNCGTGTNTWTCIYRIKEDTPMFTQETIEKTISKAFEIANDDSHGYDNTVDHNLGRPDYDCGSFLSACLRYAGLIGNTIFEPNEPTGVHGYDVILTKAGYKKLPFDYNSVKRGDILIRTGHTEMALGNKQQIGAHRDYDDKEGDSSGREISVTALSTNWTYMYRLPVGEIPTPSDTPVLQKGAVGEAVKKLQRILNEKIDAGLDVDGSFGSLTLAAVKKYQSLKGLDVDGSVGPKTWASLLEEDTPTVTLEPSEVLDIAKKVLSGDFGVNPRRRETLVKLYGEKVADKVQDVVDIVA